jgi:hypothetical protein
MNVRAGEPGLRELDQRTGDGVEVTLLWSERTGSVYVAVEDAHGHPGFCFAVDPEDALDAFRHPYAYGGRSHLPSRAGDLGAPAA